MKKVKNKKRLSKTRYIKGVAFSLIITNTMLSGCSNYDYELRLVDNENKLTIDVNDIKTTSQINFIQEVSNDDRIYVNEENSMTYDFSDFGDYRQDLDDSIVIEEDIVQDDINSKLEETQEPVVEETQEPEVEETQESEVEETQEPVVEETQEPVVEETQEPEVEDTQESVVEDTQLSECIHLDNEHIISQTLIDYIGAGNYAKWIASDIPDCDKGLSIYDYMDKFNMTKGFFYNLTANDPVYNGIDLYAYD